MMYNYFVKKSLHYDFDYVILL